MRRRPDRLSRNALDQSDGLDRLYQRLLAASVPADLRVRFEAEMLDYFRERRRRAADRGHAASARFWCVALIDLAATAWRERCGRPHPFLRALRDDLRHAARSVRRAPALSITIILLVALTVGATTAMFSVTHAVLVRPLPYADPERVVAVWEQRPDEGVARNTVGAHEFPVWAEQAKAFDALAAFTYSGSAMHLTGAGDPVELFAARVTGRFFDVMGVPPLLGRAAGPADDVPGAEPVAVLSERLWRDRFAADRAIVGRRILLNDRPHLVIGMMPERLAYPDRGPHRPPDLWVPIAEPIRLYRGRHYLFVVGRLRGDATLAGANAELASIAAGLARDLPEFSRDHSARAWPLAEDRSAPARPWLLLLLAAAACLALVGCANVASLLLARAEERRHESRVRVALGASRTRLARERLIESLLLSLAGGVLGIALAALVARAAPVLVPADLWALETVPFDAIILAFALGLAVLTGLIFGAAPVLAERRIEAAASAGSGGRTVVGPAKSRLRGTLVVVQIALALLLTTGASLFARSLVALRGVDPAFRTEDVLAVDLALPPSRYAEPVRVRQFYGELLETVRRLPGVEEVATVNHVPLSGAYDAIALTVEGAPPPPAGEGPSVRYRIVSDRYFDALRIPVVAGRGFAPADARRAIPLIRWYPQQPEPAFANAPQPMPVAVVSETMARTYWPDGAIGRRFRLLHSPWITVVGVVRDTRSDSLAADLRPECYLLSTQEPASGMSLVVTGPQPQQHVAAIREAVHALDPALPLGGVQTLERLVEAVEETPAFTSALTTAFAGAALLLMICGVYGLLAYTTAARTPEFGLRMALGATRASIRWLVLRRVLALVAAGAAIGTAASLAVAPQVETMLFAVAPTDPITLAGVVLVVAAAALAAAAIPASRATRIDPKEALR